jgi:hypothetical protein
VVQIHSPRPIYSVGYVVPALRWSRREIVLSERSNPNIRSSPWIRGVPPRWILDDHAKDQIPNFFRDSFPSKCTPCPGDRTQYNLNPARCQPTTISGLS